MHPCVSHQMQYRCHSLLRIHSRLPSIKIQNVLVMGTLSKLVKVAIGMHQPRAVQVFVVRHVQVSLGNLPIQDLKGFVLRRWIPGAVAQEEQLVVVGQASKGYQYHELAMYQAIRHQSPTQHWEMRY